ncbi:MAG: tyrosine-type recombinase/integrase [Salinibacter sp.]|uniref:tyrosine-type recombinase/integrase n=1 Tax=Salinibacter sp. TaxID=2065818 RepID=UPI0035D4585B
MSAFVKIRAQDISFRDLEIRLRHTKGEKLRDVKRVYPHLLRHTVAQRLADQGMREELLQQFLGHEAPQTTQHYYEPKRTDLKEAFEEALRL